MWLRATFLVYMSFFLLIKELPVIFLRYVVQCNMYLRSKDHREAKKHVKSMNKIGNPIQIQIKIFHDRGMCYAIVHLTRL